MTEEIKIVIGGRFEYLCVAARIVVGEKVRL